LTNISLFVGAFIAESGKQSAVADAGKIQVLHCAAVIRLVLGYTGCHKYVPFARFAIRATSRVQRVEIIPNMTTAMLFFYRKKSRFLRSNVPCLN
jgi:hypothetical protein